MDVGLVCDQCDSFNAMASPTCTGCGSALSLGGARKRGPDASPPPSGAVATRADGPASGAEAAATRDRAPARRASGLPALDGPAPPAGASPAPGGAAPAAAADRARSVGSSRAPSTADSSPVAARAAPTTGRACKQCGVTVQAGHRFCGGCGARVDAPAKPPSEGRRTMFFGAMQAARAKLVLIKGDGVDGISFTLAGQEHIAGRCDGPLLFQDDPFLSPRHANFFYKDNKLWVRDERSANGIYVRIRAPMPLRTGDTFLIGEQVLRVETTPPETAGLGPDADGTYVFASPRRASRMRLVQHLRGGDIGLVYRATREVVTLGRDDNDVNFPDDPFISGRHAQVAFTDAGLMLTDLGSKNGTFLRTTGDTPLTHGDYVFMGQQLLRVEIV